MSIRSLTGLALTALLLAACGGDPAPAPTGAVAAGGASGASGAGEIAEAGSAAVDTVVVYKTPTCGCCSQWVEHMRENGFIVVAHDLENLEPIKRQLGVPAGRVACHTARVGGYTLEGHVPADLVRRMLEESPRFKGLIVPGKPMGAPGMEGPRSEPYQVLSYDDAGTVEVYAER